MNYCVEVNFSDTDLLFTRVKKVGYDLQSNDFFIEFGDNEEYRCSKDLVQSWTEAEDTPQFRKDFEADGGTIVMPHCKPENSLKH